MLGLNKYIMIPQKLLEPSKSIYTSVEFPEAMARFSHEVSQSKQVNRILIQATTSLWL
jgi:hypothetical protein